jgi:hypothetical protein
MSDDRKNDMEIRELKDEELDKVSGGVNADTARGGDGGGGRTPGYLSVKKPPIPQP